MHPTRGTDDEKLDALFRAFGAACTTPEPSANFMPNLWGRIESRQSLTFSFRRMAMELVTAALAVSIALGVYMSLPRSNVAAYYDQSYVEALAEANSLDTPDIVGPVRLELAEPGR